MFQVPKIYWELSTRRVLFMEFMEGGQVNDKAYMERNGINVNEVVVFILSVTSASEKDAEKQNSNVMRNLLKSFCY